MFVVAFRAVERIEWDTEGQVKGKETKNQSWSLMFECVFSLNGGFFSLFPLP